MPRRFINNISDVCIKTDATIHMAASAIDRSAVGICIVTNEEYHFKNIITDGDIRRAMLDGFSLDKSIEVLINRKADSQYSNPTTARKDDNDARLLKLMHERDLIHIPILDENERVVDVGLLSHLVSDTIEPIKAVVMAGGFGTRLMPLTEDTPKPMLSVGDRPLMERTIEQLRDAGIIDISVTTHFKPEKIRSHFGTGKDFGVNLKYIQEDQPLGTAGSLKLLEKSTETLLVINGDILTNINYTAMRQYHKTHHADLTVAVRQYEIDVPYGVIDCTGAKVIAVNEKPNYSFLVNAGIYLIEPKVLSAIPDDKQFDMTNLIEHLLNNNANVVSFPIREYWLDVGQIDDYDQAQEDARTKFS